jgi:hypothetical protein
MNGEGTSLYHRLWHPTVSCRNLKNSDASGGKMTNNKQIAKQMIQFNKTALDNGFRAMTMVVEQNEKMIEAFLT